MLVAAAFTECDVSFVTTEPKLGERDGVALAGVITDANRGNPLSIVRSFWDAFAIVRRERPDIVISTGALPGLACLVAGRLRGARTIWLDSMANFETMSASGRLALPFASLRLTQSEGLARRSRLATYWGALL